MRAIFLTLLFAFTALPAHANEMQEYLEKFGIDKNAAFSGTRHMETKEGQIESFVRQDGGKIRMEMNVGDMSGVIITRQDTGKNYMLMPSMNMYREMDIKALQESGSSDVDFSEASKVGRETVNGYDCTKFKARFKDKQGGKGGGYYWVSDDGILMKIDMIYQSKKQKGQRMVMEMRDLEIGPQDPSEFEVPAGYSKMGFGSMMGQTGQGSQAPGSSEQPYEEPDLAEQVGDAVEDETEQAVVDEARKSVREGLGKLFKR